jgi:hypothetical protein
LERSATDGLAAASNSEGARIAESPNYGRPPAGTLARLALAAFPRSLFEEHLLARPYPHLFQIPDNHPGL